MNSSVITFALCKSFRREFANCKQLDYDGTFEVVPIIYYFAIKIYFFFKFREISVKIGVRHELCY